MQWYAYTRIHTHAYMHIQACTQADMHVCMRTYTGNVSTGSVPKYIILHSSPVHMVYAQTLDGKQMHSKYLSRPG